MNRLIAFGPYVLDRSAVAWVDYNSARRGPEGVVVTGMVMEWVGDRPFRLNDLFRLEDEDADPSFGRLTRIFPRGDAGEFTISGADR